MDHLEAWTSEVVSFNEKLADSARSAGEGVEILGVPFVSVKATLWSRFEIRVMDLARYVADDNPLSGESGSFWQQPGYPVGPTHPAVGITRRDAKAFCVWLGSQLNGTGSPFGRLPTQREWQRLAELEQVRSDRLFAIYPNYQEWQTNHFERYYSDPGIRGSRYLGSVVSGEPSRSGLFGLTGGVWEWTGSFYRYQDQSPIGEEPEKRLLAGGGLFGTVAFNAFPPPEPQMALVQRRQAIGFRVVLK